MAVEAALKSQNDYLVIKLIMKGAKRDIKNKEGHIPQDLEKDYPSVYISKDFDRNQFK